MVILVVYPNRHFFRELILPLYHYLSSTYDCKLVPSNKFDKNTDELCVGIFNGSPTPKSYISWILEPPTSWRVSRDESYISHMENAKSLLSLHKQHIGFFKKFNKNVAFFPYTWDEKIENIHRIELPVKQDIDVLFYYIW